jgi:cell wall-associated NlpC family hydrolase
MKIFKIIVVSVLFSLSLYAEALLDIGYRYKSALDTMPRKSVLDIKSIKQDPSCFSTQIKPMSKKEQKRYDDSYNRKFFKPWFRKKMALSWKQKNWQFVFAKQRMYTRYGKRLSKKWFKYQIRNSNFKQYQSVLKPAITLRHTDLKIYPTKQDFYYNPKRTGEGFPFDYNQNSSVNINTPLLVSHYSKDRKWVYIRCSYAYGWLPTSDIAFVDYKFRKKFMNNNYAVSIRDNLFIKDKKFKTIVKLGTIFPIDSKSKKYIIASKNKKGYANIKLLKAERKWIIAKKPIAFTPSNVALISKQLVGEPYGWGGKMQARDCSSLTKDFFAPFGIFLRRNSKEQSHDGKRVTKLRWLSAKKKKEMILKKAKPFRSLLYVGGHVTLYLGEKKGEPIIMHNYWGSRLNNRKKRVFGRSIITTTEIGKERKDIKKRAMLLNTFSKIINF